MNNDGYGIIRQFQNYILKIDLKPQKRYFNPNFKDIAKAFRFKYFKINNDYETKNKLKNIFKSKKASIIEVNIDSKHKYTKS